MPQVELFPATTVAAEFPGIGVVGAGTAHEALSDANDGTYVNLQVGEFEPTKWFRGELPNLAAGAGVVTSVVIHVRASKLDPVGSEAADLHCGDYPNVRVADALPDGEVIIDASSGTLTDLDVAEVNAAQWMAGANWTGEPGTQVVNVRIYRLRFVVDFNYVSGVSVAFIMELLGPLVAVGLHELPRLGQYLRRRHRLTLSPAELVELWRDLRQHRRPRHFLLAR